jgi:hypothetical protein
MTPRGCLLLLITVVVGANASADVADSFAEVAKVFSQHCLHCHNDIDREGEFSLQTAASLADSGYAEPGDRSSHLLSVVQGSDDGGPAMPKDADPLAPEQVATLVRWIESGAIWPEDAKIDEPLNDFQWWSLRPINRPRVPKIDDPWIRSPIDAFILKELHQQGLSPAAQADRRTLIRRLTYDLIGLPPTPEEVGAFIADPDPRAYENLVERLLESRHYGERWARHWLDVVKYADTCGYDKDKLRPNAWPYRDYVIRSLNEDKPYARFVQEQIAGDVLFPGDADGVLGLGFLAAGPWDFIGHVEVPESKIDGKVARNLDRDEMVSNTLNTFCSVTIQCARCHNHKFDPFTQQHYYSLQAIFAAVDRADRPYDLDPKIEIRRRELASTLSGSRKREKTIEREIADAGGPRLAQLKQQIETLRKTATTEKAPAFGYHSAIAESPETVKWVQLDLGRQVRLSRIVLRPCHDDFAGIGAGFGFPVRFRIDIATSQAAFSDLVAGGDADQPGADRLPTSTAQCVGNFTDKDVSNPGLTPTEIVEVDLTARFVRVTATTLATRSNDYIFALAEVEVMDADGNNVASGAGVTSLDSIEAPVRWSRKNLIDGVWARDTDPELSERLALAETERSEILAKVQTEDRMSRLQQVRNEISETKTQLSSLPHGKMVYAAATDFQPQGNFKPTAGKPRPIHLLHRGNVQQPREEMRPGLLPLAADDNWMLDPNVEEAQRRVALARWLTDKDHPLVWRSIVNRVWQYHFGSGLVDSPNDFGRMGALPTHPELLDWLATDFRDGGQSIKQLHRLIVNSSVYRQASDFRPGSAAIDGGNRYLWRMSRRRLEAEEIRDSILAVSGRLDSAMGGPGFYLFELEKATHSPHFEYHKFDPADPKSHRRSIYRFVVRSQPDPFMTTLDCADSSQSTPRRVETLTSLQALSLLNNRFNLEMAARFADRLRGEAAELPLQVDRAMLLVTGRLPTGEERGELVSYGNSHGLTNLCRMMFNFSEFVFVD